MAKQNGQAARPGTSAGTINLVIEVEGANCPALIINADSADGFFNGDVKAPRKWGSGSGAVYELAELGGVTC